MISETTFASAYTSFWNSVAPNAERFIRRLNLGLERFDNPLGGASSPDRRGFINEAAFRLYGQTRSVAGPTTERFDDKHDLVCKETREFLKNMEGVDELQLTDPSDEEWREILLLRRSLVKLEQVTKESEGAQSDVMVSPVFAGCGIIDRCRGDLIVGNQLIEIKAGDRPFRIVDIRQLLIYCALNSISHQYQIRRVGCANPRRATRFCLDIDTLCVELSGKSASEFCAEVVYFISSGDISR